MKAMVLCAGLGTRLGELTREIPKPMLAIQGQPLLAYLLGNLRQHGFDQIVINLHFKPELIRDQFGDGAAHQLQLTYSPEPKLLGTAGGVKNVAEFFRNEPAFLVHYGDILTDQDFSAMLAFHRERGALATLLLHQRLKSNSIVNLDDTGRITGFLERPDEKSREGQTSRWVNSGVCLCAPEVLDAIPAGVACDFPRDIFPKLIATDRIYGFGLTGYRCAIDSPERLAEARAAVAEGRCRVAPILNKPVA
jgi:mannose-1-phosphate guanylyltransferase/phosphomannomutase